MPETPQIESPILPNQEGRRFRYVSLAGSALLAAALLAGFHLWLGQSQFPVRSTTQPRLRFGLAEQTYAANIRIENVALSRAENFLHQEVTTFSGDLINGGDRTLRGLELTIEFSDELHQVVLRETRSVLESSAPPFAPAERRSFEVAIEHVPSSWNMQQPVARITGLQFASPKLQSR